MTKYVMSGAELASKEKSVLKNKLHRIEETFIDDESLHLEESEKQWWQDDKLGLFVHWGVYSKISKGEWAYFNDNYTEEQYMEVAKSFKPNKTSDEIVDGWLNLAEEAGMKYAVMVTRHHDGFSMWDSKASWKGYTAQNYGPKTDYVKAFTDSCHRRGMRVGLYYSPMDWRFPDYFDPKGQLDSALAMKDQCYGQIEELCRDYGHVDIIWYDGGWLAHQGEDVDSAWLWQPIELNKLARSYQPSVLLSPRSGYKGDFQCDEGPKEVTGGIIDIAWEKCMSISTAWGFQPNDHYHNADYLIRMLVNTICRGGNLLLNIGPDENGDIPEGGKLALKGLGKWVKTNSEAIFGTRAGIWEPVDGVFGSTFRENCVYLHILDRHAFASLTFSPVIQRIESVEVLNGESLLWKQDKDGVHVDLNSSSNRLDDVQVIKIKLAQDIL